MTTVQNASRIDRREEKGYLILHLSGMSDLDLYVREEGENRFSLLERYIIESDKPVAFNVMDCDFQQAVVPLFIRAYEIKRRATPVVTTSKRLMRTIEKWKVGDFINLYKSIDELPELTSSRAEPAVQAEPPVAHADYSPQ